MPANLTNPQLKMFFTFFVFVYYFIMFIRYYVMNPRLIFLLLIALISRFCEAGEVIEKSLSSFSGTNGRTNNMNVIVGFRGGVNFAQPMIIHSNEVLLSQSNTSLFEKVYAPLFSNFGYQYAFMVMVYLKKNTSLAFEPGFANYCYKYKTRTGWSNGANAAEYIEYTANHKNMISYLELPLVIRHEFTGKTITPFVSLGIVYSFRMGAMKRMQSEVTQYTGPVSIPYENTTALTNNSGAYIRSRIAVEPGIGFYYPMGPLKLMVSAGLGFGLNNIINESKRYNNSSTTAGMYDIQDDMRLGSLNLNIGILFNTGSNQAGKAVECVTFKKRKR
jgi:hypothetical protein